MIDISLVAHGVIVSDRNIYSIFQVDHNTGLDNYKMYYVGDSGYDSITFTKNEFLALFTNAVDNLNKII